VLAKAGAAWLIQQRDLTAERLSALLAGIFADPDQLMKHAEAAAMLGKPDAAKRLADLVEEIGCAA
jgi:UDP-N-acetylglucosamine--N-acetylmuramyl-(pentapeptide) pyrophosphoryl-undecaprenol N-acetylglucosamine transferase